MGSAQMLKKSFAIAMALTFSLLLTTGCVKSKIVTSTGSLGHRVDKYKPMLEKQNKPSVRGGVIYLGREYENSSFGPNGVKFVFD